MGNNKYKILIIEDDRSICSFVETLLQAAGYQALSAASCSQGLMLFSSHKPDLVVLDLGANDYITKPFGTEELLARIRVALRSRYQIEHVPGGKFRLKDLEIDYDRRQVSIADQPVHLTQTEYNILALLSHHTGRVLTYSGIIRDVWGGMDEGSIKKLQVNMANIRKKLGVKPGCDSYVLNELGVGYRMQEE